MVNMLSLYYVGDTVNKSGGRRLKTIIIFTMGTRGDVQPYIYLAQALLEEGFEVILGGASLLEDSCSGGRN